MGDIVASQAIEYLNKNDEINQFIMSRNLINNEIEKMKSNKIFCMMNKFY